MIDTLAATPTLLVASDFDGTLAGFNTNPMDVPVNQRSLQALERLARLPRTTVAILSGRDLAGLRHVAKVSDSIILAGSHGAQTSDQAPLLSSQQQATMTELSAALQALTQDFPGAWVEIKPLHVVLHTRTLIDAHREPAATQRALQLAPAGVHITEGKHVLEFSVVDITKGTWLAAARDNYAATAVVFLGDDTTDENGFRVLGAGDLGIKVGEGDTAAGMRVGSLDDVAEFLTALADAREKATGATGA